MSARLLLPTHLPFDVCCIVSFKCEKMPLSGTVLRHTIQFLPAGVAPNSWVPAIEESRGRCCDRFAILLRIVVAIVRLTLTTQQQVDSWTRISNQLTMTRRRLGGAVGARLLYRSRVFYVKFLVIERVVELLRSS